VDATCSARAVAAGRWSIAHENGWCFHLAAASGDRALARSSGSPPDSPVVLTVEGAHGLIIHAVTQTAAERGARPGARLTDARALDPALIAIPADPEGDCALVQRLAKWAGAGRLVEVDGDPRLRSGQAA